MWTLASFALLALCASSTLADLCSHCHCDSQAASIRCDSPSLLIRSVSLPLWAERLELVGLHLPHPPHFLFQNRLRQLRISRCHLGELSPHTLLPLPALESIDLSENELETLPATLLRRLPKLKYIDLSHNRIADLSLLEWILAENVVLERLVLSHNPIALSTRSSFLPLTKQLFMETTRVEKVNETHVVFHSTEHCSDEHCRVLEWQGLEELTTLDLGGNDGVQIDDSFLPSLSHLHSLSLSAARLPPHFPFWLEEKSQLRALNLSHAKMRLEAGNAWRWCGEHLESVDISAIGAEKLHLSRACPLRRVFASSNRIRTVYLESTHLELLQLERNGLKEWPSPPPGIVLDNVHTLLLADNDIATMPSEALHSYPQLQHLDVSRSQIADIHPHAFPPLGMQLVSLDLSENRLKRLPHPLLPSLLSMDVSGNELETLPSALLAGLPLLQRLRVNRNARLMEGCPLCWTDRLPLLTNLQSLEADECGLARQLHLETMGQLRHASLRGNQLEELDMARFPREIRSIDVGENRIHSASNVTAVRGLRSLRLDSNPLLCTCELKQLAALLLNETRIADPQVYYCFQSGWQYPLLPHLVSARSCEDRARPLAPLAAGVALTVLCSCLLTVLLLASARHICGGRMKRRYHRLATEMPVRL